MNGPLYPLPVLADFSRESYAHGVADERARIRQAVEAAKPGPTIDPDGMWMWEQILSIIDGEAK